MLLNTAPGRNFVFERARKQDPPRDNLLNSLRSFNDMDMLPNNI